MKKGKFPRVPAHPQPRLTSGYATIANEEFGEELISIGRASSGDDVEERLAYTRAISGDCHCGQCYGFAHCTYSDPRHIGDVVSNVFKTGVKSGALMAFASRAYDDHRPDDVVLDLGMGAGSCTAGWDLERGDVPSGRRLGVEIEPQSLRLAHAVHDTLESAAEIANLSIPEEGRLIVLSGLVFNVVPFAVAESWARAISDARADFVWVDVSYRSYRSRRHSRPDEIFREIGFTKDEFFTGEIEGFGGFGWYECEGMRWAR